MSLISSLSLKFYGSRICFFVDFRIRRRVTFSVSRFVVRSIESQTGGKNLGCNFFLSPFFHSSCVWFILLLQSAKRICQQTQKNIFTSTMRRLCFQKRDAKNWVFKARKKIGGNEKRHVQMSFFSSASLSSSLDAIAIDGMSYCLYFATVVVQAQPRRTRPVPGTALRYEKMWGE